MLNKSLLVLFLVMGLCPSLKGQAEMLGPLTREAILQNFPDWEEVLASYQPDAQALSGLKAFDRPVQVEIFLGTWCPDSKTHVSEFFKMLDLADNPLISASYIGLPRDKAQRPQHLQGKDIQKIPTFIVWVEGQEKGRIIEVPQRSIEQDLVDILRR